MANLKTGSKNKIMLKKSSYNKKKTYATTFNGDDFPFIKSTFLESESVLSLKRPLHGRLKLSNMLANC